MDLNNLMQMAEQLRERLNSAQSQAGNTTVTGEAGAGMVKVVMNGRHKIVSLAIDPKAVDPKDLTLLTDLIIAAVNQASDQVANGLKDQLGGMARDFGVDLSSLDFPGKPK